MLTGLVRMRCFSYVYVYISIFLDLCLVAFLCLMNLYNVLPMADYENIQYFLCIGSLFYNVECLIMKIEKFEAVSPSLFIMCLVIGHFFPLSTSLSIRA